MIEVLEPVGIDVGAEGVWKRENFGMIDIERRS